MTYKMKYRIYILCPILSAVKAKMNYARLDTLSREKQAKCVYEGELSHTFIYVVEIGKDTVLDFVNSLPAPLSVLYIHYGPDFIYINCPIYKCTYPCHSKNLLEIDLYWAATKIEWASLRSNARGYKVHHPNLHQSYLSEHDLARDLVKISPSQIIHCIPDTPAPC